MKVRGTQKVVKPVEVNVDTVYVRTNITRIEEEDTGDIGGFVGWEYDEVQFDKNEYFELLSEQQQENDQYLVDNDFRLSLLEMGV